MNYIIDIIIKVSGQEYDSTWNEKIPYIITGLILVAIFVIAFFYLYHKYFWQDKQARKLFYVSVSVLFLIITAKYILYHYIVAYIPDRLIFYALPSPRAQSIAWFLLPIIIFSLFLYYRKKIEALPKFKFLATIFLVFVIFSLSVAGIREGQQSIIDPYTRDYWEYTGDIHLVKNIPDFLSNYTAFNSQLSIHAATHPPGHIIILYIIKTLFKVDLLGLAVFTVILGGLTIFPLYFFFKKFASEQETRQALQLFIFIPNVVMFSATSVETIFLFFCWLAITVLYYGLEKNVLWSGVAGLCIALALMFSYLFLLLTPLLLLLLYLYFNTLPSQRLKLTIRMLISLCFFSGFYILIYWWTGYSIIDNFYVAKNLNDQWIVSNFFSLKTYIIYFSMNLIAFSIYLGIPIFSQLLIKAKEVFSIKYPIHLLGLFTVTFFLLIGVFQGEVERIWIFLVPLLILPFVQSISAHYNSVFFSSLLSLLFFQIIIIQTLFFTYW